MASGLLAWISSFIAVDNVRQLGHLVIASGLLVTGGLAYVASAIYSIKEKMPEVIEKDE